LGDRKKGEFKRRVEWERGGGDGRNKKEIGGLKGIREGKGRDKGERKEKERRSGNIYPRIPC
jgi:hypothetical protein